MATFEEKIKRVRAKVRAHFRKVYIFNHDITDAVEACLWNESIRMRAEQSTKRLKLPDQGTIDIYIFRCADKNVVREAMEREAEEEGQQRGFGLKKRDSGSIGQRVRARSRSRQESQKSVPQQTTVETDTNVKGKLTYIMFIWCLLAVLVVYYVERTKQWNRHGSFLATRWAAYKGCLQHVQQCTRFTRGHLQRCPCIAVPCKAVHAIHPANDSGYCYNFALVGVICPVLRKRDWHRKGRCIFEDDTGSADFGR